MTMRYNIQVASGALIATGAFLIEEHLFMWGGFDTAPGHEWLGLLLILVGMAGGISTRKKEEKPAHKPAHIHPQHHAEKHNMKTIIMMSDLEFSGKDTETKIELNI
jgi:hypothetical protein